MTEWTGGVFDALKAVDIRQVAYVPDMGLKQLIERCIADDAIRAVSLTTEEEGLALLGGAWMAGDRGALLMQSSGIGNCINMFSLTRSCEFPLLMLVTMRGQHKEFNPWQKPMGENAANLLETVGVTVETATDHDGVGRAVADAAQDVFTNNARRAVLVHQSLMAHKTFGR
ncbi:MAG: thiamine pyrophosphate-binding protein [Proteobacteria bacterium]|nr:thiamine pyrophosphate-binding protein [Pseudomonadota bacterium]MDA1021904.1 thiamine pyrophosphate-binding protein [Pseudomonadota bacterium]